MLLRATMMLIGISINIINKKVYSKNCHCQFKLIFDIVNEYISQILAIFINFALRTRGLSFPLIKEILRGTSNDFRNRGIPIGKGSYSTALF